MRGITPAYLARLPAPGGGIAGIGGNGLCRHRPFSVGNRSIQRRPTSASPAAYQPLIIRRRRSANKRGRTPI